jgi:uncharacterized membrane protein
MRAALGWVARGAGVLAVVAIPATAHVTAQTDYGATLAAILIAVQTALIAWLVLSLTVGPAIRCAGSAAVFLVALAVWQLVPNGALLSSAVPHALIYLALLSIFTASLAPGREAIITVFARNIRGVLPPSVVVYTRRVTVAWCCFFATQLLGSALLLLFAPLAVWSVFVNILNVPLVIAMFTAEYVYRQWRHAHQPRDRFSDVFRMVRQIKEAVAAYAK